MPFSKLCVKRSNPEELRGHTVMSHKFAYDCEPVGHVLTLYKEMIGKEFKENVKKVEKDTANLNDPINVN